MTETRAIVVSLDGNKALVESLQAGGCGNCDSENGCGSGKLSQLFCSEPRRFRVRNDVNAKIGTVVLVTVAEGVLLRSALLMYFLPLILMLCAAMFAAQFASNGTEADAYAAAGGLAGLFCGFMLANGLSLRQRGLSAVQPEIVPSSEAGSAR